MTEWGPHSVYARSRKSRTPERETVELSDAGVGGSTAGPVKNGMIGFAKARWQVAARTGSLDGIR